MQILAKSPTPIRDTRSLLGRAAREMVQSLQLCPPPSNNPSYWTSEDGFFAVGSGLVKMDFRETRTKLRAKISFEAGDTEAETIRRIEKRFPHYNQGDKEQKRAVWSECMTIAKEVRQERVAAIIAQFDKHGVDIPVHNIRLHRVAYTFEVTLDLETLRQIHQLCCDVAGMSLRGIKINEIAEF